MDNKCLMCGEIIPEGMQVCCKCRFQTEKEFHENGKAKLLTGTLYEKLTAMTPGELAEWIRNIRWHCLNGRHESCPLYLKGQPCTDDSILEKLVMKC